MTKKYRSDAMAAIHEGIYPRVQGIGLARFIPGTLLATAYFVYTYRSFSGKVNAGDRYNG